MRNLLFVEYLLWPVATIDFLFRTQALIYYNFKQAQ